MKTLARKAEQYVKAAQTAHYELAHYKRKIMLAAAYQIMEVYPLVSTKDKAAAEYADSVEMKIERLRRDWEISLDEVRS